MREEIKKRICECLRGDKKYYKKKYNISINVLNKWIKEFKENYGTFNESALHFRIFIFNNYIYPDRYYFADKDYSPISYRR